MARFLRREYAGAVYRATSGGTKKKPVFRQDLAGDTILTACNQPGNGACRSRRLFINSNSLFTGISDGNSSAGKRKAEPLRKDRHFTLQPEQHCQHSLLCGEAL